MAGWRIVMALVLLGALRVGAEPPLPPIEPGSDDGGFDWVQLDSGEWLRGEFMRMLDETLYFDSEEFDDQDLDWSDVASLVSAGPHTFRIEGRDPVMGTFEMRNGTLRIETETGEVIETGAAELLSLIPGEGRELDFWSFSASLSFTAQDGNTEQTDLSVRADASRESPLTRWVTSYRGNFGSSNGETTAESHRIPTKFDYFLTSRLFLTVGSLEYFTDSFQNIATRLTAGSGIGYELVDAKRFEWEVATGGFYQSTSYESVLPGDQDAEHDGGILLATRLDFDFPHGIEWDNSYSVWAVVTDLEKTSHHGESILDFDIWGPLEFEVGLIFDRIEQPRPKSDGERPERNDYRLTVGLGIEY